MLERSTVQAVLSAALATGGDFAELYAQDSDKQNMNMLDGKIEQISSARGHGAGVRVLLGTRSIYAHSNDTSAESLLRCAKAAAAALAGERAARGDIVFSVPPKSDHTPVKTVPSSVERSTKAALLRDAHRAAKAAAESITQVSLSILESDQRVLIANSEGLWAEDRRVRTRFYATSVAGDGTQFQTGSDSLGMSMGYEAFTSGIIDPAAIAEQSALRAAVLLNAPECPAGSFPVVIDGGFGGVIFHEACGHALESSSVSYGNSVFAGKLGQKIAASCVTAIDDGTMKSQWGTSNIDDEGHPTQKNLLIQNGVLVGYLIDKLGGRRMGLPSTGSGRRQDHTYAPTSRMNNTYIAPGTDDEEEMIRTMGEGLYAKSMGGGQVNPLTGDFTFGVAEGYWIKDGKILTPVRGAALVGKGSEVLLKIDRVGSKMWLGQGMCGAGSGSIPVALGQPRIRVSSMTVGGKGGAL